MLSSVFSLAFIGFAAVAVNGQGTSTAPINDGLQILSPGGSDVWWVNDSENTLSWTCQTSTITNFTVIVMNPDPTVLTAPFPIFAQQENYVCEQSVGQQQLNLKPAQNYTILFADPFNNTNVYVSSLPFELKALGATYPDPSATPTASFTASATAPSGSAAPSSSGSSSPSPSAGSGQTTQNGAVGKAVNGLALMGAVVAGMMLI